jgi:hypothetical protein
MTTKLNQKNQYLVFSASFGFLIFTLLDSASYLNANLYPGIGTRIISFVLELPVRIILDSAPLVLGKGDATYVIAPLLFLTIPFVIFGFWFLVFYGGGKLMRKCSKTDNLLLINSVPLALIVLLLVSFAISIKW